MNIGIDIDDTITYTYETLLPMVALRYGLNVNKLMEQRPSYKMLNNTLPNYKEFALENYCVAGRITPVREGAIEVLTKLREQGHKIILITARDDHEFRDPEKLSKDYLERNKIPYDKLIVRANDKVKHCILEGIDLFIDDNTNHCRAVQRRGINTLQFDTIFTEKTKELERVNSWEEIYNKVQEMYT